jgi:hypothetical protein
MRNIRSLASVVLVVAAAPLLSACYNVEQQPPKSPVTLNDALLALKKVLWPNITGGVVTRDPKPPTNGGPTNDDRHKVGAKPKAWHRPHVADRHPANTRRRQDDAAYAQSRKARESRISRRSRTTVIELNRSQFAEDIHRRVADYLGEKRLGNGRDPLVLLLVLNDNPKAASEALR